MTLKVVLLMLSDWLIATKEGISSQATLAKKMPTEAALHVCMSQYKTR